MAAAKPKVPNPTENISDDDEDHDHANTNNQNTSSLLQSSAPHLALAPDPSASRIQSSGLGKSYLESGGRSGRGGGGLGRDGS